MEKSKYLVKCFVLFSLTLLLSFAVSDLSAQAFDGSGDKGDPFLISSADDLDEFRESIVLYRENTTYFKLSQDIVYNKNYSGYSKWGSKSPARALKVSENTSFYNIDFDGNGHTIFGLYGEGASLLGVLSDSSVHDLTVSHYYFKDSPSFAKSLLSGTEVSNIVMKKGIVVSSLRDCSSFVEYSSNSTFKDVSVGCKFTVKGEAGTAGAVCSAFEANHFENFTLSGTTKIDLKSDKDDMLFLFGNLVGTSFDSSFKNCVNNSKITVSFSSKDSSIAYVAGLLGTSGIDSTTVLDSCTNNGKITFNCKADKTTYSFCGGIAADASNAQLKNCVNNGQIKSTGAGDVGGIAARASDVSKCLNTGKITAHEAMRVGGICGGISGNLSDCENRGDISSNMKYEYQGTYVGGIAGYAYPDKNDVHILRCKNEGSIFSDDPSYWASGAGILGDSSLCYRDGGIMEVAYCYNTGTISGSYCCGIVGYVGYNTGQSRPKETYLIRYCYNSGTLIENKYDDRVSGITFGGYDLRIENCFNSGRIEGIPSSIKDPRTSQITTLGIYSGHVKNCVGLTVKECPYALVASTYKNSTKLLKLYTKTQIEKNKTVKKIIKKAGL